MAPVPPNQPLTSIAAFALALVEASSRLTESTGPDSNDATAPLLPATSDDTTAAAVE